jgi:hypothetical protein
MVKVEKIINSDRVTTAVKALGYAVISGDIPVSLEASSVLRQAIEAEIKATDEKEKDHA